MNLGTLTVILTANTNGLNKAVRDLNNFKKAVGASTAGISQQAAALGRDLTRFVTIPLALIGGSATKAFADFEFEMKKIQGLAGQSADDVAKWTDQILKMAPAMGKTPLELAESLYFVASSGVDASQAMEVLTNSAKAAKAGLGETQVISNIITSSLNAYGNVIIDSAKATDILVATVREGKAEANHMVSAMGVVLPIASKLGVSFDQVGAALAVMTRTGSSAATSGVQLRQMFMTLMKPSIGSKKAIEEMGGSFGELRNILADKGLLAMLNRVNELTGGASAQFTKIFPNVRALNGVMELLGKNSEEIAKVFEDVKNSTGDTDEALGAVENTVKIGLQEAWSDLMKTLIELGGVLSKTILPILQSLLSVFKFLVSLITSLPPSVQGLVVAFGAFAAVVGPLTLVITTLSSLFTGWGKVAILGTTITSGLTTAFNFLSAAIAANPIGALITLITTVAGVMYMWTQNTKKQADAQARLNKELKVKQLLEEEPENKKVLRSLGLSKIEGNARIGFQERLTSGAGVEKFAKSKIDLMGYSQVVNTAQILKKELKEVNFLLQNTSMPEWYKTDMENTKATMEAIVAYMDAKLNAMEESNLAGELTESEKAAQEYANSLKQLLEMEKLLGEFFDYDEELLRLQTKRLEELTAESGSASKSTLDLANSIKKLTIGIGIRKSAEEAMQDTMRDSKRLEEDLMDSIDRQAKNVFAPSDDLDDGTKKAMDFMESFIYMQDLDKKIAAFGKGGAVKFTLMDDKLRLLRDNLREVISAPFDENWMANVELAASKYDKVSASIAKTKVWQDALVDSIGIIGTAIGESLAGAEGTFKKFATAILQSAGAIIGALLSIALAKETVNKGLVAGLIVGAIAVSAMLALMSSTKSKAKGLKDGGIIPPGYPNDTFTAQLSSNEAVIPLEKLPQLMGMTMNGRKQEVVFTIEGRVMKGIMQDANSVSKAY